MLDVVRRIRAGVTRDEEQRLETELQSLRTELDHVRTDGADPWQAAGRAVLDHAERCLQDAQVDSAWAALKTAERMLLHTFDAEQLGAEADAARVEGEAKLTGWRRDAVTQLLGQRDDDGVITPVAVADVVKARETIDEHADNVFRKLRFLRRAVLRTSILLALVLGLLGVVMALGWIPDGALPDNSPLSSWRLLLVVMVLGALGALLSSAIELRDADRKISVPDLRINDTLMWMRPVVGAAGAVIVIVVLQSGLDGAVTVTDVGILPVAVAAGFTERLVTKTVNDAAAAVSK